jgi:glutathione S-transferase
MITLYTFGPHFGLPDPSPFVTKTMIQLKMAGLAYRPVTDFAKFRSAPKGKLPYIDDDGTIVADSALIRAHIERKYGFDFDAGYDAEARGRALAAEKLLEDCQYWVMVYARWIEPANWPTIRAAFFDGLPFPLRLIIPIVAQRTVRRNLHGQGLGRHSGDEIYAFGDRNMQALSDVLGEKRFLLGDRVCGADATVLAFLMACACPAFNSPMVASIASRPNLADYCSRLRATYF